MGVFTFENGELPEPKGIYLATVEANNLTALSDSLNRYETEMSQYCGGNCAYKEEAAIKCVHEQALAAARARFNSRKKMGGRAVARAYASRLDETVSERLQGYLMQNEQKKPIATFRKAVLIAGCVAHGATRAAVSGLTAGAVAGVIGGLTGGLTRGVASGVTTGAVTVVGASAVLFTKLRRLL